MDDQYVTVDLREHHGRVRGEVAQALVGDEPQLVVTDEGVVLDEDVRAAARVVGEARQGQLLGARVAADGGARLEYQDLQARAG